MNHCFFKIEVEYSVIKISNQFAFFKRFYEDEYSIVHTCRFKVSLKNDDFSSNFRDFGFHYYNGVNLKSDYLSLKMKKVCTPLVIE